MSGFDTALPPRDGRPTSLPTFESRRPVMTNDELRKQLIRFLTRHRRGITTRSEAISDMSMAVVNYWDHYAASPTRCLPTYTVGGHYGDEAIR